MKIPIKIDSIRAEVIYRFFSFEHFINRFGCKFLIENILHFLVSLRLRRGKAPSAGIHFYT